MVGMPLSVTAPPSSASTNAPASIVSPLNKSLPDVTAKNLASDLTVVPLSVRRPSWT
jgi:hypothetical protein